MSARMDPGCWAGGRVPFFRRSGCGWPASDAVAGRQGLWRVLWFCAVPWWWSVFAWVKYEWFLRAGLGPDYVRGPWTQRFRRRGCGRLSGMKVPEVPASGERGCFYVRLTDSVMSLDVRSSGPGRAGAWAPVCGARGGRSGGLTAQASSGAGSLRGAGRRSQQRFSPVF